MQDLVLELRGGRTARVHFRRHPQARRITLRIDRRDHIARVSVPRGCSRELAASFVRSKAEWIDRHLQQLPGAVVLGPGVEVPVRGDARQIRHVAGARSGVHLLPEALEVGGALDEVGRRVEGFLKQAARRAVTEQAELYASRGARTFSRITLRDTRSRWGSCSSSGGLNFSWRLVMAPAPVLDYVVAHEVAHLTHMDHGSEFWGLVEDWVGDWRDRRQWLRRHGAELMRYCAAAPN